MNIIEQQIKQELLDLKGRLRAQFPGAAPIIGNFDKGPFYKVGGRSAGLTGVKLEVFGTTLKWELWDDCGEWEFRQVNL